MFTDTYFILRNYQMELKTILFTDTYFILINYQMELETRTKLEVEVSFLSVW